MLLFGGVAWLEEVCHLKWAFGVSKAMLSLLPVWHWGCEMSALSFLL